jgi:hypothetical protein
MVAAVLVPGLLKVEPAVLLQRLFTGRTLAKRGVSYLKGLLTLQRSRDWRGRSG